MIGISNNSSYHHFDEDVSDLDFSCSRQVASGISPDSSKIKKKRGRKAADNYLANSKRELEKMRSEYDKEKASLHVKERAKRRNRISALESRIKKREL